MMPNQVVSRQNRLLPVAIEIESCRVVDWLCVERAGNKRAQFLALCTRKLERKLKDIEKKAEAQRMGGEANRNYFDTD